MDAAGVDGRPLKHTRTTPGEDKPTDPSCYRQDGLRLRSTGFGFKARRCGSSLVKAPNGLNSLRLLNKNVTLNFAGVATLGAPCRRLLAVRSNQTLAMKVDPHQFDPRPLRLMAEMLPTPADRLLRGWRERSADVSLSGAGLGKRGAD